MHNFFSKTFFLYLIYGGLATVVDWGVFALSVYGLGIHYALSVTLSFTAGSITNFSLNKYFNFKNNYKKVHVQFMAYLIVAIIGLVVTLGFMWFFIELLRMNDFIARIITTALVLIYNYLGHKHFTFRFFK